jgi:hypothetical protein
MDGAMTSKDQLTTLTPYCNSGYEGAITSLFDDGLFQYDKKVMSLICSLPPLLLQSDSDQMVKTGAAFGSWSQSGDHLFLTYHLLIANKGDDNILVGSHTFPPVDLSSVTESVVTVNEIKAAVLKAGTLKDIFDFQSLSEINASQKDTIWFDECLPENNFLSKQWGDVLATCFVDHIHHASLFSSSYQHTIRSDKIYDLIAELFCKLFSREAIGVATGNFFSDVTHQYEQQFHFWWVGRVSLISWLSSEFYPNHYRLQATVALPILFDFNSRNPVITKIIDQQESITDYLHMHYQLSKGIIKWLGQLKFDNYKYAVQDRMITDDYLIILSLLNRQVLPPPDHDYAGEVIGLVYLLIESFRIGGRDLVPEHHRLIAQYLLSAWKEGHNKNRDSPWAWVSAAYNPPVVEDEFEITELRDALTYLERLRTVNPEVHYPTTLGSLYVCSNWYHENINTLQRLLANYRSGDESAVISWPSLLDDIYTTKYSDGSIVELHVLATSLELLTEGEELEHCVGGYIDECVYDSQHILSCRSANGSLRSTVNLRIYKEETPEGMMSYLLKIEQHTGVKNSEPAASHKEVVAYFVSNLNAYHGDKIKSLYLQSEQRHQQFDEINDSSADFSNEAAYWVFQQYTNGTIPWS